MRQTKTTSFASFFGINNVSFAAIESATDSVPADLTSTPRGVGHVIPHDHVSLPVMTDGSAERGPRLSDATQAQLVSAPGVDSQVTPQTNSRHHWSCLRILSPGSNECEAIGSICTSADSIRASNASYPCKQCFIHGWMWSLRVNRRFVIGPGRRSRLRSPARARCCANLLMSAAAAAAPTQCLSP